MESICCLPLAVWSSIDRLFCKSDMVIAAANSVRYNRRRLLMPIRCCERMFVYVPIDCHQITNNFAGMGSPVLVVGECRHVVVHAVVGLCSLGQMFRWYGLRIQKVFISTLNSSKFYFLTLNSGKSYFSTVASNNCFTPPFTLNYWML
jgi:hypothetical protein